MSYSGRIDAARVAEHDVDALAQQRLAEDVGTDPGRGCRAPPSGTDALDEPSWSISRWARSTAAACSVPAAGMWLRRARSPFVSVTMRSPSVSVIVALRPPEKAEPPPLGGGPVGSGVVIASCDRSAASLRAPAGR